MGVLSGEVGNGNNRGGVVTLSSLAIFTIIFAMMDCWDSRDFCSISKAFECCWIVSTHNESSLESWSLIEFKFSS